MHVAVSCCPYRPCWTAPFKFTKPKPTVLGCGLLTGTGKVFDTRFATVVRLMKHILLQLLR